jgi:hypothetical protein
VNTATQPAPRRSAAPRNRLGKRLHVGIFGPSLCGKSNVAKWLMLMYWQTLRVRSLVLDPNPLQAWPACALRFYDAEKFWPFVWTVRGCAVFADEMSSAKTRRQTNLIEYFTRGRQNDHVLHVMGHAPTNLLPDQRNQLQTLFLFDQSPDAAEMMAREWSEPRIMESVGLPQYEFLQVEKYGNKATRRHLIRHGIFPEFK